jgi:hypothetical protein
MKMIDYNFLFVLFVLLPELPGNRLINNAVSVMTKQLPLHHTHEGL